MNAQLVGELVDLKRVHTPDSEWSLAGRRFLGAWGALLAGEDPTAVAINERQAALAACRLGAIDATVMRTAGLDDAAVEGVFARALEAVGAAGDAPEDLAAGDPPPFALRLARQPRAGATRPGHPRLMLAPAETHAEHCWVVAVAAAIVAEDDPTLPFLAGLAHHAHNAALPDAGFTGEMLLGEHLDTVITTLRDQALAELPDVLRARVREALAATVDASTPAGRAFHTADVLDRVLEMRWHARTAGFTLDEALVDLDLVHEGPLQEFGLQVVEEAGLR